MGGTGPVLAALLAVLVLMSVGCNDGGDDDSVLIGSDGDVLYLAAEHRQGALEDAIQRPLGVAGP